MKPTANDFEERTLDEGPEGWLAGVLIGAVMWVLIFVFFLRQLFAAEDGGGETEKRDGRRPPLQVEHERF